MNAKRAKKIRKELREEGINLNDKRVYVGDFSGILVLKENTPRQIYKYVKRNYVPQF